MQTLAQILLLHDLEQEFDTVSRSTPLWQMRRLCPLMDGRENSNLKGLGKVSFITGNTDKY